ncbi:unnamed protein product [Ilex paraguariensis]|uniref:VQ domain-containing protein n=1 Tax=Ilex paraguariensis TaxID=185542 RepID=A0ABC8UWD3_9AQUA
MTHHRRNHHSHISPHPVRRRLSVSRRTPTTLLNMDTTNFRVVVQQFTGGPRAPFVSGSQYSISSGTNFNFKLKNCHQIVNPTATMVPSAYHLQFQQHQNYMFPLNDSQRDHDAFGHRLNNSKRSKLEMEVYDGPRASSSNEN